MSNSAANLPAHVVWHRSELRLHDNPALAGALASSRESGGRLVPLVIIDEEIFKRPDITPRRAAWFLANVAALREAYRRKGADLLVREGKPATVMARLQAELKKAGVPLASVHCIQNYTPYAKKRDEDVRQVLEAGGVALLHCPGHYICEPGTILTNQGGRYGVYSAFRRKWDLTEVEEAAPTPGKLPALPAGVEPGDIPRVKADIELPEAGEAAALKRLHWFLDNAQRGYPDSRNRPAREDGTSRLSYYFTLGVMSSRVAGRGTTSTRWSGELAWRDFMADVMDRRPDTARQEYDERWHSFPWRQDREELEKWQQGRTGYPMVDAGMRELLATGYMHNRVRMICASFLTKHLLLDWKQGEEWFRSQLLDGDRAQNVGNWQWCAGCGVDAAPYFRVFNPTGQGEKFDARGEYVKRWIPELEEVPTKLVYTPWEAGLLRGSYPEPMIELAFGRDRFLETAKRALSSQKGSAKP